MDCPWWIAIWYFIAAIATILMFIFVIVPGMPSALVWPQEYIVFVVFVILGIIYYYMTPAVRKKIPLEQLEYQLLGEYGRSAQQTK